MNSVDLANLGKTEPRSGNELTGTIPTWLGDLANLERLRPQVVIS